MESVEMMKMATGEGSPLRQGAGTGSRVVFGGYRGLRRRNSRSNLRSGSFRVRELYRQKKYVSGATRAPRGRGRAPHPRGFLVPSLTWGPSPSGGFRSKNNFSS